MAQKDAQAALQAFIASRGETDTTETDAVDLIADLLIFCHHQGEDAEAIARMAVGHFEEETEAYKTRRAGDES